MSPSSNPSAEAGSWERLEAFSRLAGPLREVPTDRPYRVRYRDMRKTDGLGRLSKAVFIAVLNLTFEGLFVFWLLRPGHFAEPNPGRWEAVANVFVICSIGLVELLRLINVVSLSLASLAARDPVPVAPDSTMRVAFLTTIVPSKEPLSVVRDTLRAALRIRHRGVFDVWLLDEGNDPAVIALCKQLGVRHFSRNGIEHYNQHKGAFRAKTKHGNYNAWVDRHGDEYDVFLSVDPDHVPLANFAERILGYFRDPDVAYVVGPQCYKNSETFVTRAAESQQFPFHSVIQRAANRYNAAMLVGTNNAIRISALRSIGGLSDSITEDMATGLKLHTTRNPQTRRRWKSVYTPDVLAAGEGPSSWSDYFSQQRRWSRGTFEILHGEFWKRVFRLSPGRLLHYGLITTFYPSMAVGWLLGAVNAILFLALGVSGIIVAPTIWFALYVDATAFSLWLYLSNRRYNVSPYEAEGSAGLKGMLMSVISAPIYAAMLVSTFLRRPARFVVTPKGESSSSDGLRTFRNHIGWMVVFAGALGVAFALGHAAPAALLWPTVALLVSITPIVLWRREVWQSKRAGQARPARPGTPDHAGDITMEIPKIVLQDELARQPRTPAQRGPVADRPRPASRIEPAIETVRIPTQTATATPIQLAPSATPAVPAATGPSAGSPLAPAPDPAGPVALSIYPRTHGERDL
ncbi:glycosyltransferase family 2 protein [Polymorphospora sp. NPDC050346]|uniref:glycosyltransferase family 2 protein n=1 Tax=Polymorphospora sp. NPDC050346 TaxID=3155780 RepID=UPI0033C7805B